MTIYHPDGSQGSGASRQLQGSARPNRRWLEMIGEFDFSIQCWSGHRHGNADGLSRQAEVLNIYSNISSNIGNGTNGDSPELAEWVTAQQEDPDIRHARCWIIKGVHDAD